MHTLRDGIGDDRLFWHSWTTASDGSSRWLKCALRWWSNVWKILVAEGDAVAEGDTLVILESMKMEIPVLAEDEGVFSSSRWPRATSSRRVTSSPSSSRRTSGLRVTAVRWAFVSSAPTSPKSRGRTPPAGAGGEDGAVRLDAFEPGRCASGGQRASFARKRSRSTTTRSIVPTATVVCRSLAVKPKTRRRPSTSVSSAVISTWAPTGCPPGAPERPWCPQRSGRGRERRHRLDGGLLGEGEHAGSGQHGDVPAAELHRGVRLLDHGEELGAQAGSERHARQQERRK